MYELTAPPATHTHHSIDFKVNYTTIKKDQGSLKRLIRICMYSSIVQTLLFSMEMYLHLDTVQLLHDTISETK